MNEPLSGVSLFVMGLSPEKDDCVSKYLHSRQSHVFMSFKCCGDFFVMGVLSGNNEPKTKVTIPLVMFSTVGPLTVAHLGTVHKLCYA